MKKFIAFFIILSTLISVLPFAAASADDIADVPRVYITTSQYITTEYSSCEITVVDSANGGHATIKDNKSTIKVRGNSTSSGEKKPFNIKFSSKTDVLGMGKNKKWCLLANCYEKTLLRNQTVLDFAEATHLKYTPSYRVVDVYINGKYNGMYMLTDAIGVSSTRVDIDDTAHEFILERDVRTDEGTYYFQSPLYGYRFGINDPEKPTDEQLTWLRTFLTDAEYSLANGKWNEVKKYFDIDTMVDFYIVLEYFKNVDIEVGSTRFYIKNGKIYGGPCWDFDLSSGNCSSDYYTEYNNVGGSGNSYEGLWAQCIWYKQLWKFEEFRDAVKKRYLELQDVIVNLYENNILGSNYLDKAVYLYGNAIKRNYNLWSITYQYSSVCGTLERLPESTYEGNLEYFRNWLKKRNEWLLEEWELESLFKVKVNSPYVIKNNAVSNARANTSADKLLLQFVPYGAVYSPNGKKLSANDIVYNGCIMSCGGLRYKIYVTGDLSANGYIDSRDYVLLKRGIIGSYSLSSDEYYAGDIDGNGKLTARDYAMLKRHVLGTYDIYK